MQSGVAEYDLSGDSTASVRQQGQINGKNGRDRSKFQTACGGAHQGYRRYTEWFRRLAGGRDCRTLGPDAGRRVALQIFGLAQRYQLRRCGSGRRQRVLSEEEKKHEWSSGDRSFRCGAYVVAKKGDRDFEIRHVGDVNPEMEAGELMRLCYENGRWEAQLNAPRTFALGPIVLVFEGKFELWKVGLSAPPVISRPNLSATRSPARRCSQGFRCGRK